MRIQAFLLIYGKMTMSLFWETASCVYNWVIIHGRVSMSLSQKERGWVYNQDGRQYDVRLCQSCDLA